MSLSKRTKDILTVSMADKRSATELATAVDALHAITAAAHVAPLGTTSNLVGVDGTGSNAAPLVGTEARLDAIEAKIDAVIASLIAASIMS